MYNRWDAMKVFRVDRYMMGRHAPETYRTTKRDRLLSPKTPSGDRAISPGRKNASKKRMLESAAAEQEPTKIECVPWMPKTKRRASTKSSQTAWKA